MKKITVAQQMTQNYNISEDEINQELVQMRNRGVKFPNRRDAAQILINRAKKHNTAETVIDLTADAVYDSYLKSATVYEKIEYNIELSYEQVEEDQEQVIIEQEEQKEHQDIDATLLANSLNDLYSHIPDDQQQEQKKYVYMVEGQKQQIEFSAFEGNEQQMLQVLKDNNILIWYVENVRESARELRRYNQLLGCNLQVYSPEQSAVNWGGQPLETQKQGEQTPEGLKYLLQSGYGLDLLELSYEQQLLNSTLGISKEEVDVQIKQHACGWKFHKDLSAYWLLKTRGQYEGGWNSNTKSPTVNIYLPEQNEINLTYFAFIQKTSTQFNLKQLIILPKSINTQQ